MKYIYEKLVGFLVKLQTKFEQHLAESAIMKGHIANQNNYDLIKMLPSILRDIPKTPHDKNKLFSFAYSLFHRLLMAEESDIHFVKDRWGLWGYEDGLIAVVTKTKDGELIVEMLLTPIYDDREDYVSLSIPSLFRGMPHSNMYRFLKNKEFDVKKAYNLCLIAFLNMARVTYVEYKSKLSEGGYSDLMKSLKIANEED